MFIVSDELTSAVATLAAVFLGWLLGEGTSQIRERQKRRRTCAALIEELLDCEGFVRRNTITAELLIQIVEVKAFAGFVPVAVPQTVFEKYYPEVVVRLSRGERISFSAIHARIREMNKMTEDIAAQMTRRCTTHESVQRLAESLAAFYITAHITTQMIMFHRASGRRVDPSLLTTEEAKEMEAKYMAQAQELRSEAARIGYDGVTAKILMSK